MTDWTRYDVPALVSFLTEDDTVSWHQVTAWQHTYELLSEQGARLAAARAELADAWPPEKSDAASTFISFVDELTASMNDTGEIALTNRAALVGVLGALAEARQVIDDLHARWQTYAEMDRVAALPRVHAVASTAPPNWSAALNAEAHRKMVETDQVIFENSRRMTAPDVLQIGGLVDQIVPLTGAGGGLNTPLHTRLLRDIHIPKPPDVGPGSTAGGGEIDRTKSQDKQSPTSPSPPMIESDSGQNGQSVAAPVIEAVGGGLASAIGAGLSSSRRLRKQTISSSVEGETGNSPSTHEPLTASGMIGPSVGAISEARKNKRTASGRTTVWRIPTGVPDLIISSHEEDRHDPGPGVIGIDR